MGGVLLAATANSRMDWMISSVLMAMDAYAVCLVAFGAGMSVDSGLRAYDAVAAHPVYAELLVEYGDLCRCAGRRRVRVAATMSRCVRSPSLLREDPRLFWGFWLTCVAALETATTMHVFARSCFQEYQDAVPHEGYAGVRSRSRNSVRPPLQLYARV